MTTTVPTDAAGAFAALNATVAAAFAATRTLSALLGSLTTSERIALARHLSDMEEDIEQVLTELERIGSEAILPVDIARATTTEAGVE